MQDYERLRKELAREMEEHRRTRAALVASEELVVLLREELELERSKSPPLPVEELSLQTHEPMRSAEQAELVAQCSELEARCTLLENELNKKVCWMIEKFKDMLNGR